MASFRSGKCKICDKTAYPNESLEYDKQLFHKTCFKCLNCKSSVSLGAVAMIKGDLYCKNCFVRMFQERGSYQVFKNPNEGRVPTSVPSGAPAQDQAPAEPAPAKDVVCQAFVPQAYRAHLCQTCQKPKAEHSEQAQKAAEEVKPSAGGSAPSSPAPKPKKIGCKFGFKPASKFKPDICAMCGKKKSEHEGESDAPASPTGRSLATAGGGSDGPASPVDAPLSPSFGVDAGGVSPSGEAPRDSFALPPPVENEKPSANAAPAAEPEPAPASEPEPEPVAAPAAAPAAAPEPEPAKAPESEPQFSAASEGDGLAAILRKHGLSGARGVALEEDLQKCSNKD
jgi:cysteine/glycine-rich protein